MPKVFTVNGANEADELKRMAAHTALAEESTEVLERLVELSRMPKAVGYLKNGLAFAGLKAVLK